MRDDNQPTLCLVHGYIGAGKTVFAKRLAESPELQGSAVLFSMDEWMARLYGNDPPEALFQTYYDRAKGLIFALAADLLNVGVSVILDWGFWRRAERDEARAVAQSAGASVKLFALSCPEDVAWERVERRNQSLGHSSLYIDRHCFDVRKSAFEPLADDEEADLIEQSAGFPVE